MSFIDDGLAFWIVINKTVNREAITHGLQKMGVPFISPEQYCFNEVVNGVRLGYASLSAKYWEEGVRALAEIVA